MSIYKIVETLYTKTEAISPAHKEINHKILLAIRQPTQRLANNILDETDLLLITDGERRFTLQFKDGVLLPSNVPFISFYYAPKSHDKQLLSDTEMLKGLEIYHYRQIIKPSGAPGDLVDLYNLLLLQQSRAFNKRPDPPVSQVIQDYKEIKKNQAQNEKSKENRRDQMDRYHEMLELVFESDYSNYQTFDNQIRYEHRAQLVIQQRQLTLHKISTMVLKPICLENPLDFPYKHIMFNTGENLEESRNWVIVFFPGGFFGLATVGIYEVIDPTDQDVLDFAMTEYPEYLSHRGLRYIAKFVKEHMPELNTNLTGRATDNE